jgi:shikimate dehydrogenase
MHIDGSTKLVGVFGWPVTHTASPAMHNAAFEALRMNWAYLAFPVHPQSLRSALHGARDLGLAGINLTVPHKILGLDIVDEVDSQARRLGAVNTICIENNQMRGFNTDGYGFAKAIKEEFNLSLRGKRVLVLGAGGAGRAIAIQCALDGAAKVFVANRTPSKIEPIARDVSATKTSFQALELKSAEVARNIGDVDLLVNATTVGLAPKTEAAPAEAESLGLDSSLFSSRLFVYDAIYQPAETALLRVAAEAGAKVANGLGMLLHQGARSFELWTKRKAPVAVMRRALHAAVYGENA